MRLSVLIPVAPYHADVLQTALDSLKAQTEAVHVLYAVDHDKLGPGYIRNQLLQQVTTPYVTFLDADDWVAPEFAQVTCDAMRPGRYVFTDWMQDSKLVEAPDKPWCAGTWHPVTSVVWTQDAKNVEGFDENLDALEDTDFWLRLTTRRICGIRIARPLFHYGLGGLRGKGAQESGLAARLLELIMERYKGKMGCCGDRSVYDNRPVGEKQDGDVEAMALWRGNRVERGRATGRRYQRMSYPRKTWVAPADIDKRPDLWQQVIDPAIDDVPAYDGIGELGDALSGHGFLGGNRGHTPIVAEHGDYEPDFDGVINIASERL